MKIRTLQEMEFKLDKSSTQRWSKGWVGNVKKDILGKWQRGTDYELVTGDDGEGESELSTKQTKVLGAAANQAIAGTVRKRLDGKPLSSLKKDELLEVADEIGLEGHTELNKEPLLAAVEAWFAEVEGA